MLITFGPTAFLGRNATLMRMTLTFAHLFRFAITANLRLAHPQIMFFLTADATADYTALRCFSWAVAVGMFIWTVST